MIQFRRGSTKSWRGLIKPLAAGQPGYDKNKHKIKIGDGKTSWKDLPYAGGLSEKEILDSEENAKNKNKADAEDKTVITYGTSTPDKNTVGQVYLQYYDAEPEVDYVVEYGVSGIWTYQKRKSGIAECWGTITLSTGVQNTFEEASLFYSGSTANSVKYPFIFKNPPTEIASIQSSGGLTWLASKTKNTTEQSATYVIISPDKLSSTQHQVSLLVKGFLK